jgi:hypothetical protein
MIVNVKNKKIKHLLIYFSKINITGYKSGDFSVIFRNFSRDKSKIKLTGFIKKPF